jgi:hypothetical protein
VVSQEEGTKRLVGRSRLKGNDEPSELLIYEANLSPVGLICKLASKRFRGFVGIVGIKVVNPEKERGRRRMLEPSYGAVRRAVSPPFHSTLVQKLIVVKVKTAVEARGSGEGKAGNEGSAGIADLSKLLGEQRDVFPKPASVFMEAVPSGIKAGQHRGVGRQRRWRGGVGVAKHGGTGCQVSKKRGDVRGFEAGSVSTRGVQGDEEQVGARRAASAFTGLAPTAAEDERS